MKPTTLHRLEPLDRAIINAFQDDFPLASKPYHEIAERFGITEAEVIERLKHLQANKIISRIGAIIRPNTIGASTLCTMAVEHDELDKVAEIINCHEEVNHNYQRSHEFNLWFVVTAKDQQHLSATLNSISASTGYKVVSLPLEAAYYLNLGFKI